MKSSIERLLERAERFRKDREYDDEALLREVANELAAHKSRIEIKAGKSDEQEFPAF